MINRIRVVTLLVMVLGVFALLQLISGSLFFSSLHHSQKSFVVSNQLREQQGELTSTWDLMLQTRINLSRSAVRMMMDSSNQQSNAKVELLDSARKTLAQAATHYKKFKSMAPLPEMVATSRNIDEKYKNYYTALTELIDYLDYGNKQMAIDADLNAGLIGEDEAKKRRSEVTQEADFYGSMDGASKFVRGDAIAGILIMVINVVGGLLVGVLQHGMSMGHAAESYTLLTIGDGLVAQIPALVISTAAGVIVTRVSTDQDVGEQMVNQLFSNPSVMLLSAAVLGLLGLVPGMPNLVFLLFTAGLLGLAWWIRGREQKAPAEPKPVKMAENNTVVEATWNDVQLEDSLGMEVGYRLIPMVDFQQDGELLGRILSIRKKFAQEMGFLPPVVHIRDNMDLQPARYRILMKGVEIGSGDAYPGRWLAINPGTAAGTLPGEATVDPAFGLNAIWIESALKEQAQIQGYTVVEASTVVATHLNHLISQHAAELFGRQEAQQLLDRVAQEMPKLTEDLVPGVVTLTTLHKVLQNLLDEKVPIRDMRTILETLAEHAPIQSDPHELTAVVRVALGRAITQQWFPGKDEVHVIGLDTPLERLLLQALQGGGGLEPGLADRLLAQTQEALSRQEMLGAPPVLLVNHALRPLLSRFLRRSLPQLVVLSNLELSDNRHIRMTAIIGGK
ncbi:flagellar type III secretion system protein FlhA [Escherichia coli]|nr:flagellar type III secretion system protein FlhA [Escherichia coli]